LEDGQLAAANYDDINEQRRGVGRGRQRAVDDDDDDDDEVLDQLPVRHMQQWQTEQDGK